MARSKPSPLLNNMSAGTPRLEVRA
jgi:hypothetical protein